MPRMPVLFVSHGSPEIAVRQTPAHDFLRQAGDAIAQPRGIVVVSAHWETGKPTVATAAAPETIYDFGPRFDARLWEISYNAPGASDLALQIADRVGTQLSEAVALDDQRGRDHGVWTPLHLMYPARDIPVTQISIQPHTSPAHHADVGAALAPLRDDGVLILASGAITHNLSEFRGREIDADEAPWVREFRDWMCARIEAGDRDALLDYRNQAPCAERNHPEDEHLLPIFVALGAGAGDPAVRIHDSVEYGVIGMDAYGWGV